MEQLPDPGPLRNLVENHLPPNPVCLWVSPLWPAVSSCELFQPHTSAFRLPCHAWLELFPVLEVPLPGAGHACVHVFTQRASIPLHLRVP